ncbi:MAG: Bax inhibitor-1/YccA family protein [Actinomycetes bacterium]
MESRNPVLRRQKATVGFNEPTGVAATPPPPNATPEQLQEMYNQPPAVGATVTIDDVVIKTGILFVLLLVGAVIGWNVPGLWIGAAIIGLILGLVNAFKRQVSPPLVIAYALVQGVFLGGISQFYAGAFKEPIVQQAVLGTLVAFAVMLVLYRSRIIKVDGRFKKIMFVALISYLVIGVLSFISALFGVGGGFGFYGVGPLGLILCLVGVALASLTLALDFEAIAQSISMGLPERESWRLGFALMVTLIWLYLEILRFLAILNSSR